MLRRICCSNLLHLLSGSPQLVLCILPLRRLARRKGGATRLQVDFAPLTATPTPRFEAMSSDRENGGPLLLNTGRGACSKAVRAAAPPPLPPPFRFGPPRALIDWRALHSLDLGRVVRETDVDALEGVLDVVAYGDLEAEDHRQARANSSR